MRNSWIHAVYLSLSLLVLGNVVAVAQTDVALSLYGAFNGTTNGNGTVQSPSNAAGGIVEVRHISNPLVGYEGTYSYNRANQVYNASSFACPVGTLPPCGAPAPASVSANAHEVSGDWIASVHIANLRPFALAGVGLLFDVPSGGQSSTDTVTKPVFIYGAGLDWSLIAHLGLRFQYRGNLYKAPDLTKLYTSTDAFTHTAEPMIGGYFRF
jgi:hypothetical protein